jgi:hypothetical protein
VWFAIEQLGPQPFDQRVEVWAQLSTGQIFKGKPPKPRIVKTK